jgi:hypothetical protein
MPVPVTYAQARAEVERLAGLSPGPDRSPPVAPVARPGAGAVGRDGGGAEAAGLNRVLLGRL